MNADARRAALLGSALTLLLDRAGGSLEFVEADYQAVLARYGGATRINLHFEVLREAGRPDRVRLVLEQKVPANGELVS